MRLIDADALLENYDLKNAVKYGNKSAEQRDKSYSTLMMYEIADMIDDAPTIESPRDWTPCAEGMPKEHEKVDPVYDPLSYAVVDARYYMVSDMVNVTVQPEEGKAFCCSDLTVNGKWEIELGGEYTVIAWRPHPEPYNPDHIVDSNKKVEE